MKTSKHAHLCVLRALVGATLLAAIPITAARAENWALLIGIDQYDDTNRINPSARRRRTPAP